MTESFVDHIVEDIEKPLEDHPIPVRVVHQPGDQIESTQYRSVVAFTFILGTEAPVQVLAQDPLRKSATLYVQPGFVSGNTAGMVFIGDYGQVINKQGGIGVNGNTIKTESSRALWVAPDGVHSLTVTVVDDRYANEEV